MRNGEMTASDRVFQDLKDQNPKISKYKFRKKVAEFAKQVAMDSAANDPQCEFDLWFTLGDYGDAVCDELCDLINFVPDGHWIDEDRKTVHVIEIEDTNRIKPVKMQNICDTFSELRMSGVEMRLHTYNRFGEQTRDVDLDEHNFYMDYAL